MTTSRRRQIALASLLLLSPAAAAASNRKKVAFQRSVVRPAMSLKQNMKDSETMTNLRNNIRRLIVPSKTSPFSQLDNGTIKIDTSKNVWNLAQRYSPTFLPFYGEHDLLVHIAGMYDADPASLTAVSDSYGIAPGTHLTSQFMKAPIPLFLSKGTGWVQRENPTAHKKMVENNSSSSLYHHVVYLGNGWTYGYPEGLGSVQNFMGDNKKFYEVVYPASSKSTKKEVFRRAIQVITHAVGPRPSKYDKIQKNCEHMATYIMTGKAQSIQVSRAKFAMLGIGSATLIGLIAAAAAARKVGVKLMRRWGFKPGMRKDDITRAYERHKQSYSILNSLRGRIPKELSQARNAALSASKQ
jgi:hypothetical protein